MSFVRALEQRKYSEGDENEKGLNGAGLYVFVSAGGEDNEPFIDWMGGDPTNREDFVEVMLRIWSQSGNDLSLEQVNRVRDRVGLDPIDEINEKAAGVYNVDG